ncbi:MAG TPA: transglutaminase domain-containing protein [Bacteroidota bacterium]
MRTALNCTAALLAVTLNVAPPAGFAAGLPRPGREAGMSVPDSVRSMVDRGEFTRAGQTLRGFLQKGGLPRSDSAAIAFEIERLDRIRKDFKLTRDDVLGRLEPVFGAGAGKALDQYTRDGSLESMVIDGQRKYFSQAVRNLYLINPAAARIKRKGGPAQPDSLQRFLRSYVPAALAQMENSGSVLGAPTTLHYKYTLTVHADAVPPGETIRCWLPYPRTDVRRQTDVRLIRSVPGSCLISSDAASHKTAYLEQKAVQGKPALFSIEVEYRSRAERGSPAAMTPHPGAPSPEIAPFTGERPPHIVFTPAIRALSRRLVARETNKEKIARAFFSWISNNIPWASAREYSTLPAIPEYCLENRHGDCGIKTLLFMTLCRLNGIPARWESGWDFPPGNVDMHDWCEISLDGNTWVPVDQNRGLQPSNGGDKVRFFYLGGIDSYRLIVNNDYGRDLYPPKLFPRSETVDFQRGEVEWKGGNLYFDKWSWHMDVTYPAETL